MKALLAVTVGLVTGALSGMGIGGGTLLVVWLIYVAKAEQLTAQGINLLYFLPTAAAGLIGHILAHRIRWKAFLLCAIPGTLCAILGSLLAGWIPTGFLQKLFGGLLCVGGLLQIFKKPPKNS